MPTSCRGDLLVVLHDLLLTPVSLCWACPWCQSPVSPAQVAAALLSLQALPQLDALNCQLEAPTVQVARSATIDKLLPQPGAVAQQLYARWRAGVPLAVVGTLDGMNVQVSHCLSAISPPMHWEFLAYASQLCFTTNS